jgi:hypothetical protein
VGPGQSLTASLCYHIQPEEIRSPFALHAMLCAFHALNSESGVYALLTSPAPTLLPLIPPLMHGPCLLTLLWIGF